MIRIIARPNPFESEIVYCDIKPGLNLTEIVGRNNNKVHIQVEGVPVPNEAWDSTYPKSGEVVTITVVPGLFGLEGVIAGIVGAAVNAGATAGLTVAGAVGLTGTTATTVAATVGGVIGGAIGIGAMIAPMILPFLVKPQLPSISGSGYTGQTGSRFSVLNSNSNPNMQYGVIPKLYGEFRITPPVAGNAYTRLKKAVIVGQPGTYGYAGTEPTQTYHLLLCLGYGPLKIGGVCIGPQGLQVTDPSTGNVLTCQSKAGTKSPTQPIDCLDQDALAILVGDTPFRQIPGSLYTVGTAKEIVGLLNREGWASYPADIEEDSLSLTLPTPNTPPDVDSSWTSVDGVYQVWTAAPDALKVEVDIVFDALYASRMKDDPNNPGLEDMNVDVVFRVLFKKSSAAGTITREKIGVDQWGAEQWVVIAAGSWQQFTSFTATARSKGACAWTVKIDLPSDADPPATTYDILVIRQSTKYPRPNVSTSAANATWMALRSLKAGTVWDTSEDTGLDEAILMAVEFQASRGFNGGVDPISIRAKSIVRRPVADTLAAWGSNKNLKWVVSSSPAWAFADAFIGPQLQEPFKKDRIDWPALIEWANWCDGTTNTFIDPDTGEVTRKITDYNWYHVEEETILDRIRTITSCGRAAWNITGGLFSVTQDANFYPVQLLSPRNSRNLEITKSYPKIPNALRVRYVHPKTWQQDEVIVLDDYYLRRVNNQWVDNWGDPHTPGQDGYKKAKTYEVLETQGVTSKAQAKREGRYHLANLRMRPEFFTCEVDFEHLVAQRGDCVLLSHDVLLRGWAFGRVLKITAPTQQSAEYRIDVDTDIEISDDANFAVQVRSMNTDPTSAVPLAFIELPLSNPPGTYQQLWVSSSHAAEIAKIAEGDLFVFGPLDEDGDPTGSLLAKITQIDYQADMSAKITMTYAAPGIPAADDGIMDDDGDGPAPKEIPPPPPSSFRLLISQSIPDMTVDGARYTVDATWELPTTGVRDKIEIVEVTYRVGEEAWQVVQVNPTAGNTYPIKGVPPETQVTGKARCLNSMGASDYTAESTLITPSLNDLLPQMPTNLDLVQDDYREANGRIRYFIKVNWVVNGLTAGTEIQWIRFGDIEDPANWPDDNRLGKTFIDGSGQFFQIENVDVTMYKVRLRSKSIIPINGAYQYSAWAEGSIDILVYDYPPGPPTNLQAKSTPSGIMLTWDNPLDSDFAGIQIFHSTTNNREGDLTNIPVIPEAKPLASVGNPVNSYFHVPDDRLWHYYWIYAYDSEDGIHQTNKSSWERPGNNDGVRGRQGIFGDGLPPPPPINLVLYPDTWQVSLQWEQSQEIPDLYGTQIYWSKTNDRGPDDALLATYLFVTDENFATHLGLETGETYYYWIRNMDVEDPPQFSTWLPEDRYGGAAATVPPDPRKYLELLNGAITETQLAQSLLGLINSDGLTENATFLQLQKLVSDIEARVVLKLQQNYEGLSEVAAIGFGTEVQNGQIVSQFLVQADRLAMGAPQVFNSDGIELVPIQYGWDDGNLPVVYDIAGNVITPCDRYGQPLPAHDETAKGAIRLVYDENGERMPIYGADHELFPTPRWDGFVITTEEYWDENGVLIPPGVYIRNANIAEASIDGAKIQAHTIKADRIDANGLVLFDSEGKPIFAGGGVGVDLEAMFGLELGQALRDLKAKDIHLWMKNAVIGDLYIADTLSSVDYSPSYINEQGEYVPGTGWRIHRGSNLGDPSTIETDNLVARGTLSSDIYVAGAQGWKLFKDGSVEVNNGVFRGTLGAETLLVGTDFTLKQLSEQVLLASLNISASDQYFSFNSSGVCTSDLNLTMFINNIDNILWSATGYPGGVQLQLTEDEARPRYRFLNNEQIKKAGGGYYDYIEVKAQFQDRYDIVRIYPLIFESGIVTAELSNARINLAADSSGYVGNYSLGTGRFRVHHGTTEVAKASLAFSVVGSTGCAVSIVSDPTKPNHGVYKVTDLTSAAATATLRATYNGVNYDRTLDVLKYQAILSGAPGEPGEDGTDGKRGSKFFVFYTYNPDGYSDATWSVTQPPVDPNKVLPPSTNTAELLVDAMVRTDPGSEGIVVYWDVVTLINYATGWSETRMRRDTGWEVVAAFFNGDIIVKGTIYADKIVSNSIIRLTSTSLYASTVFAGGNQWQPQIGWISPNPKYVVDAHPEKTGIKLVVTVTMDCPTDLTGVRIAYEQYVKDYWNQDDPPAWRTQYREIFNRGSAYYSARVFTASIVLELQVPPGKAFNLYVEAKQLGAEWVNADANLPSLSVIETFSYYFPDDDWRYAF
jgi:hypothetical protein